MSLEESITQGLSERLSMIHEQEYKSVEDPSDEFLKSVESGDGRGKVEEVFEDEGVGPESCESAVNQPVGQYQPSLSDFSGDSVEEDKKDEEKLRKWESEVDAVQESDGSADVLNDHGLESDDDEDRKGFYNLHDHKRSRYMMADLDVEQQERNDKVTSFEFDVTKDHGLNSDSEDEHSEKEKEKEDSGPPVKKKKKFKPWKKLRRLFKKETKFAVDESQNKDDSHQESTPSQLPEKDEDENLPVSTEEFILSSNTDRTSSHNLTSDTQNGSSPSRQRTESDEGLPLSPDTPSLNFDLDVKPSSLERSNLISADKADRSLQAPNGHYHPTPSPRTSIRSNLDQSSAEFDSVASSTTKLNSDAAKHRISVKPSSRRPSSRYRSPQGTTGQAFDFDVSSFSFASESFDEETEMEQKSAFGVNYKDGPMNPPEGEPQNINGILDQLIEESKDATMEVETNAEVEVSPSVSVKEEIENVEEPEKIKEAEERFTFRLPEDEERIEDGDRDSDKAETEEEILVENGEVEEDDIGLKYEENERTQAMEKQEEEKMEIRTETLTVNKVENVYENVEENRSDEKKKEEAVDVALMISSTVEDTSLEKTKQTKEEVVKEDTSEKPMVMKPSPQPRKKIPPPASPKVDSLNDGEVVRRGKEEETKENRALSIRDRISRLQMNAQPVAPVAPVRSSPRNVVTKPKPRPVSPVKVKDSVTSSGEKGDAPGTDQPATTKKTDPSPKRIPTQRTDPPTKKESKEGDVPELPARGGVKALIMRFQENQSQFSAAQRQAEVAS